MEIIMGILAGAGIGGVAAIALYLLGFVVEIFNLACMIVSCDCDRGDALPFMWDFTVFLKVMLFCAVSGAIIGLIYGACRYKERLEKDEFYASREHAESVRRQEIRWAEEYRKKAQVANTVCENNLNLYKFPVKADYLAEKKMTAIIDVLAEASELQGRMNTVADEVLEMGGEKK